jgi:8-oxo-dGTP pyrophosphatase MutT (NUDIX family)
MSAPVLTPRPAATTMVLRDGAAGLEVLLLRRSPHSVFVPGAHVFPGGAVDPIDHAPHPTSAGALTDDEASARLGLDTGGLAFWVAAVRETFEEAGLLIADGPVDRATPDREAVDRGERALADVCADHGLTLRLGDLRYFGHWVTPPGAPRRYTTRFFVAPAPPGQEPAPDDGEAVASEWVRPQVALDRFAAGDWDLIQPTESSLRALDRFADVTAVLAHLDDRPPLTDDHGGRRVALPPEPVTVACQEIPT